MAGRRDISIEQGANLNIPITIKNSDGSAFDLTDWTIVSVVGQINVDAVAGTFTRLTGSFVDDGFVAGMKFKAHGFSNGGNNVEKIVQSITALVITVTDKVGLTTETGSGDEYLVVSPRGQIRRHYRSIEVVASFDFTITNPTGGAMTIEMLASITKDITAGETDTDIRGQYVYDIEIEHKTTHRVKRLLKGNVNVSPEVTRVL